MGWAPIYRPDTDVLDEKLIYDQLRLAMRNLRPNAVVMPLVGAVVCVVYAHWVPAQNVFTWAALVLASVIPQGTLLERFLARSDAADRPQYWLRLCSLGFTLFVVAWASMAFFLWQPDNIMDQLLLMLLIACTLAGTTAISSACAPLAVIGTLVYGTTLILIPLRQGGEIMTAVAMLAAFYVGYMIQIQISIHRTARDMLVLMHERTALIDRLKMAKDDSDRARERAEQASQAKSQFLANMSHELRTPLNAILGFSEMVQAFCADAAKSEEYAGYIHDSGKHLLALINDILDLAKIEAGGDVLREAEILLADIIADCLRLISPAAEVAGVRLTSRVAALPVLFADPRALRQVLLNLLSNALKFTPEGGEVQVFAEQRGDGSIAFGVHDTGIGIAADDQGKIFEKFGQGRYDVATIDKGTGLGLAIVKGLIEAHGGEIFVSSTLGEGSTFTAILPAFRTHASLSKAVA
ncbi:MAG: HAMP domain-containing histidine kinase [Alphaproteobacteria bacterium]|nr:HAMP domain-containing histidine kinase [Alphaproteobacteria bacterium]